MRSGIHLVSPLAVLAVLLAAGPVLGQAINIDFADVRVPTPAFAAAGNQPGVWNDVVLTTVEQGLVDVAGNATAVRLSSQLTPCNAGLNYGGDSRIPGEFGALMGTGLLVSAPPLSGLPSQVFFRVSGLSAGSYTVYVYARPSFTVPVSVATSGGTLPPIQPGTLNGNFSAGLTHTSGTVTVGPDGFLILFVAGEENGIILHGLQLVPMGLTGCQIAQTPTPQLVVKERTATFTAGITGDLRGYQWLKDGQPLSNGRGISGVTTPTLTLAECRPSDNGQYALRYTCGGSILTTPPASLGVIDCAGDFDRSGQRTIDDIFIFLSAWFAGCP